MLQFLKKIPWEKIGIALKEIPWKEIAENAPAIICTIKELKPSNAQVTDAQSRLAALENNISQQTVLIGKLAEQNALLTQTVETLSTRLTITFGLSFFALLLAGYAIVKNVFR